MDIFQIDDQGRLFISPAIRDWSAVEPYGIDTVIDLDNGLDTCIPTTPDRCLYVYFPFLDDELPNLTKLRAIGRLGASLVRDSHRVLSHCGMGFNRSALVAGLILIELGLPGTAAVVRLRERRPGALFNERYATFLESLGPAVAHV